MWEIFKENENGRCERQPAGVCADGAHFEKQNAESPNEQNKQLRTGILLLCRSEQNSFLPFLILATLRSLAKIDRSQLSIFLRSRFSSPVKGRSVLQQRGEREINGGVTS